VFRILVVEDDTELRELFCEVLSSNGYTIIPVSDGLEALEVMEHTLVDLIVSDIMMPHMDGYELTKALRESGNTVPILMITARDAPSDKREGFRLGTDDYMVKPIDVDEMVWRVEALLRRASLASSRIITVGSTTLDFDSLTVTADNISIELPQKEFGVLFKLLLSPGRIFTRRQIMDDIWGLESETDTHTLEVHISRLRERLRSNPDFEIVTVRGLGYKAVKRS
jgi:two-component system OmpR family response regulator